LTQNLLIVALLIALLHYLVVISDKQTRNMLVIHCKSLQFVCDTWTTSFSCQVLRCHDQPGHNIILGVWSSQATVQLGQVSTILDIVWVSPQEHCECLKDAKLLP